MNLETRGREAAENLAATTPVDVEAGLQRLRRTHKRRTVVKVAAGLAAVAVGLGVAQVERDQGRALPSTPSDGWVLVNAGGGSWTNPLARNGRQAYPAFASADPTTRRFLVRDSLLGTAWYVLTPGSSDPVFTIPCSDEGCPVTALGPGPDEVTTVSNQGLLEVLGPDYEVRETLGPAWTPTAHSGGTAKLAWAPDGQTWAETRYQLSGDVASMTVVLRRPDSPEVTTFYDYSEEAPRWYDVERQPDPGGGSDPRSAEAMVAPWGGPEMIELQWSPDSTRLAFVTVTASEHLGDDGEKLYELRLFVGDTATGDVDQVAVPGQCDVGVFANRAYCADEFPALAWAPDGKSLMVLADSTLTTYDPTGKVLDSEPASMVTGPLAWLDPN